MPDLAESQGEFSVEQILSDRLRAIELWRNGLHSREEEEREIGTFRISCHSLLLQSEFGYYVFVRPRGYSGDFHTQEMIWLGRTEGGKHRYRGITKLGKLLTSITLNMAAPRANELRIRRIADLLGTETFASVASIGSGAGIEFGLLDCHLPSRIFLLDQDLEALSLAGKRIPQNQCNVIMCHENVLKYVLRNERHTQMGQHDLIYSLGMLDYLPIKIARKFVAGLWSSVSPGGILLLVNAHPRNPSKFWMEWVTDWYLDYKNESELKGLSDNLPSVKSVEYELDAMGVYQYLTIKKE